jgi:hypothetical protein
MKTYITFGGLAIRTGIPATTLFRRVRELQIQPDAITVAIKGPSIQLWDVERLPSLRQQLRNPVPK